MNVLLDNNISPLVARAINILVEVEGERVVALRDEFAQDTPDIEWIARSAAGAVGWLSREM